MPRREQPPSPAEQREFEKMVVEYVADHLTTTRVGDHVRVCLPLRRMPPLGGHLAYMPDYRDAVVTPEIYQQAIQRVVQREVTRTFCNGTRQMFDPQMVGEVRAPFPRGRGNSWTEVASFDWDTWRELKAGGLRETIDAKLARINLLDPPRSAA